MNTFAPPEQANHRHISGTTGTIGHLDDLAEASCVIHPMDGTVPDDALMAEYYCRQSAHQARSAARNGQMLGIGTAESARKVTDQASAFEGEKGVHSDEDEDEAV